MRHPLRAFSSDNLFMWGRVILWTVIVVLVATWLFGGKAGIFGPEGQCLLLTQSTPPREIIFVIGFFTKPVVKGSSNSYVVQGFDY